jgi:hypothetical protein
MTFVEMGFCSSSWMSFEEQLANSSNKFIGRRYRLEIKSKTGRNIDFAYCNNDTYKDEREVLFAPETVFRVNSWKEEGYHISFEVEEIEPSPFLTESD